MFKLSLIFQKEEAKEESKRQSSVSLALTSKSFDYMNFSAYFYLKEEIEDLEKWYNLDQKGPINPKAYLSSPLFFIELAEKSNA